MVTRLCSFDPEFEPMWRLMLDPHEEEGTTGAVGV
jgi:hypothetical protein